MPKYELIKSCSNLLDIFHTESDEKGVDILEMSDFFNIFVSNTIAKIGKDDFWVKYNDLTNLMGNIYRNSIRFRHFQYGNTYR